MTPRRTRARKRIETLPNLIEDSADRYDIRPRKLWRWALDAILKGALRPMLSEEQTLDTEFSHGGMGPLTLRRIIEVRRDIQRYDSSYVAWANVLKFNPASFENWLKSALRDQSIPVHPKRRAGATQMKRERAASYIAEKYGDRVPAGITIKGIVRDIKARIGLSVSERTVLRALGRK
jgi:hypothetical protein